MRDLLFLCHRLPFPPNKGEKIRAYAVTSTERLDVLPKTPTMAEAGAKLDMTIWHGLYAPKGTPAPVLDKLNAALRTALKEPSVKEKFKAFGTSTFPEAQMTRDAHGKLFAEEVDKWAKSLAAAGVKPQG